MSRVIEAKAIISGEDRTGKMFDSIQKNFEKMGKASKVAKDIGQLGKQLDAASASLRNVDRFRATQGQFTQARTAMRTAQMDVGRIASALDGARKAAAAFDGVKSFSKSGAIATEIASARKQVTELERQLTSAQRAVKGASTAYEAQAGALKAVKGELSSSGVSVGKLVSEQNRLKAAVEGTTAAILKQEREQARNAQVRDLARTRRAERQAQVEQASLAIAERRQARRDAWKGAAGIAGLTAVHKAEHFGAHSLHTYQEFDNERRFGRAVMGLTDEQQRPLVEQAIHMGGTTRYNDVQVLEAQRELAARGLKKDQVMGLMEPAANLGQALDLRLPEAVKQMEGAIFGFKKDISTLDAAKASAKQTADVQVKAAKISGMTPEDISQAYKYGATPARMAGLSEETLLAFAGISKKANMGGDEAGVAFRALVAAGTAPTRGAKEALKANGFDYKNYQRAPDKLNYSAFKDQVAAQYGVTLDKDADAKLGKVFASKALIADPAKFTPAIMDVLGDVLGGDDAKSKKSIAGLANRFRDKSMGGIDMNAFVADLMKAIPGNLPLANAIFGAKQGARIANALGDPETLKHMIEELLHHAEGYAQNVSDQRNAGFDGAKRRLDGAITNVETKLGRAWDNDGNGGFLTGITDKAGHLIQHFAELDNRVVQAASVVAAFGTAFVGIKSLGLLTSGFGLTTSAAALDGSAAALTAAAAKLGAGGALGNAAGALGGGGAAKAVGRFGALGALGFIGTAGLGIGAIAAGVGFVDATLPNHNRMNGYGRLGRKPDPGIESYPAGWGEGGLDVAGGIGAQGGPYATNRAKTWSEMIFGSTRAGARDPTRMELPTFGFGDGPKAMPAPPPPPVPQAQGPYGPATVPLPPSRPPIFAGGTIPVQVVSMPAGSDASGQADAIRNSLDKAATASATAANGGKPIEATVKPDQISAKVTDMPPVTGEAKVDIQNQIQVRVSVDESWITAKVESAAGRAAAKIPLASSGARPGAVSMPGAASTPGAR
ncbi:phage tail tape measure protein [Methylobacterium sp. SI9]|uniref:phage tail tape measure protein n=1 Tax=Methylobacterium guangdongense TaxID=3138811 RepID=UPI00313BF37E